MKRFLLGAGPDLILLGLAYATFRLSRDAHLAFLIYISMKLVDVDFRNRKILDKLNEKK